MLPSCVHGTAGRPSDPAVVCFPGAGIGKECFITKVPVPGIYLIAVDYMGHGQSTPLEADEITDFGVQVPQV